MPASPRLVTEQTHRPTHSPASWPGNPRYCAEHDPVLGARPRLTSTFALVQHPRDAVPPCASHRRNRHAVGILMCLESYRIVECRSSVLARSLARHVTSLTPSLQACIIVTRPATEMRETEWIMEIRSHTVSRSQR